MQYYLHCRKVTHATATHFTSAGHRTEKPQKGRMSQKATAVISSTAMPDYILHEPQPRRNVYWLWLSVFLAAFPHYYTDPGVSWGNGRRCPLVVHYWVDLQSVYGFRCYDNTAPNGNVSECLYSLYAWLHTHACSFVYVPFSTLTPTVG